MEQGRPHRFTRRRNRHAPPRDTVITGTLPSPEELQALNASIRQSSFPERIEKHLCAIRKSTYYIEELNTRRSNCSGTLRDAYTTIITETLRDMMRLIDVYKTEVCESITDYEAGAILNMARFPNLARF